MRSLPAIAIVLGLAGLLPFFGGSLVAVSQNEEWRRLGMLALQGYAAVILAFLGGVHWGIGLEAGTAQTVGAQRARFGLGVVPSLVGWAGLLVTFIGLPLVGLAIEAAGFIGLTIAEARGARRNYLPSSYMALRWVLSIAVIVCLVSVLIVVALNGHVALLPERQTQP